MSRALTPLCLVTLLISSAIAQQAASPPEQMKKYDAICGYWNGKGVSAGPDGQETTWTLVSHARRVMGGHFVRDDARIMIDAGAARMVLTFINIHAWDAHRQTHVAYSVANDGVMAKNDVTWTDDNTMVQMSAREAMGSPILEHWKTTIHKDEVRFISTTMGIDGKAFSNIKGRMTRSAEKIVIDAKSGAPFMVAVGSEMKKLNRMAGNYSISGKYAMGADTGMVEFKGTEGVRPIFGGLVLEAIPTGDGYEGYALMGWDPKAKIIRSFNFSSWGIHQEQTGSAFDGGYSFITLGDFMGQQMLNRTLLMVDANGKPTTASAYAMMGRSEPSLSFRAKYTQTGKDR